jgi:hypothetical protein
VMPSNREVCFTLPLKADIPRRWLDVCFGQRLQIIVGAGLVRLLQLATSSSSTHTLLYFIGVMPR